MEIKYILKNISILRSHICQEFLEMIAADNWRSRLYPFLQKEVDGIHRNEYIEQYKIIRRKGIENYSFKDMDVSFIVKILNFGPEIATFNKNSKHALIAISEDRNMGGHSSDNESADELYLYALVWLRNLQNFLHIIDENERSIPDENRSKYVQKYSKAIAELKLDVYNDCIELFQIKKDIQSILNSENQKNIYNQLHESYWKKSKVSDEHRNQMYRFEIEASNAGIKDAHDDAALYYEYVLHDSSEATRRYEKMIDGEDKLSLDKAHQLIDFVNHAYMTGKKPSERMQQFVKLVKDQGFNIKETPNGVIWMNEKK